MGEHHHIHDYLDRLHNALSAFGHISEKAWRVFSQQWTIEEIGRKVNITKPQQTEQYTYFVIDGIQRLYYLDEEGREATIIFTYANDFGGVLDSYLLQRPSSYFYETLSKSLFLRCHRDKMEQTLLSYPSIAKAIERAIHLGFSGTLTRLVELQILSSEEKFKKLIQRSPHILHLIPHKYLANYIGIDPTNFSKLINSVKVG